MNDQLRRRARWYFGLLIGIYALTFVAAMLEYIQAIPPILDNLRVLLIALSIGLYFGGLTAMNRLKGFAIWHGVVIGVLLFVSSSAVRVIYKPAQPIVWLLMAAYPIYLSTRPDAPNLPAEAADTDNKP